MGKLDTDLYNRIICALSHNIKDCDNCKKCLGDNGAIIRINLMKQLAKETNNELPFKEDENEKG